MRIADRVFVVSGAGSGIGREVAREVLRRGGSVAAVDLNEASLRSLADEAQVDDRLSLHPMNITDVAGVAGLPGDVIARHGTVDGLLSIAGIIQPFQPVTELARDAAERVMNVNFWGTYNLDTAFLPLLLQRPEACLLNVASMGALAPVPGQGVYGASKAAVKLLTECLYAELRDSTVRVTLVIPGAVGTNITANSGVEAPTMAAGSKAPPMMTSTEAARQIVDAVEKGEFRVLLGRDARMLDRLARVAPVRAITTIADRMKALLG